MSTELLFCSQLKAQNIVNKLSKICYSIQSSKCTFITPCDTAVIITYLENSTTMTILQAHLVLIFNLFKLRCGSEKD